MDNNEFKGANEEAGEAEVKHKKKTKERKDSSNDSPVTILTEPTKPVAS